MASLFTKIIRGELPSHKVYEDDKTLALLNIYPALPGHVLVVPKVEIDRVEDLSEPDYVALMTTVKKVMRRLVEVFGPEYRAVLRVQGYDIPHAHVHVLPARTGDESWEREDHSKEPDHEALAAMAKKLRF